MSNFITMKYLKTLLLVLISTICFGQFVTEVPYIANEAEGNYCTGYWAEIKLPEGGFSSDPYAWEVACIIRNETTGELYNVATQQSTNFNVPLPQGELTIIYEFTFFTPDGEITTKPPSNLRITVADCCESTVVADTVYLETIDTVFQQVTETITIDETDYETIYIQNDMIDSLFAALEGCIGDLEDCQGDLIDCEEECTQDSVIVVTSDQNLQCECYMSLYPNPVSVNSTFTIQSVVPEGVNSIDYVILNESGTVITEGELTMNGKFLTEILDSPNSGGNYIVLLTFEYLGEVYNISKQLIVTQ